MTKQRKSIFWNANSHFLYQLFQQGSGEDYILGVLFGVLCVLFGILSVLFGVLGVLFGILGVLFGILSVLVGVLSFCLAYLVFVWCTWCLVYVVFCLATLCILRHNWCLCHWDVVFLTFRIWDGLSNISITKNVQIWVLNIPKCSPYCVLCGKRYAGLKKVHHPRL